MSYLRHGISVPIFRLPGNIEVAISDEYWCWGYTETEEQRQVREAEMKAHIEMCRTTYQEANRHDDATTANNI